jgi:formylglycine-generating enzyme required for sulfatase activity
MGSPHGDPDERPVHPVRVPAFWITEAPITWTRACAWLGWEPPPHALPRDGGATDLLYERNKLRYHYCASPAVDHWSPDAATPERCDVLPMVGVGYADAEAIARAVGCALPTEAQWEKAARGGLVGCRYSWGDEPPTRARCDFDRMGEFRLADARALPPNGYGLYGACGGVWEWTADRYDALAYTGARADDGERVIRGGSWTDCAAAVTVSFRASSADAGAGVSVRGAPNIGFRVVTEHDPRSRPPPV